MTVGLLSLAMTAFAQTGTPPPLSPSPDMQAPVRVAILNFGPSRAGHRSRKNDLLGVQIDPGAWLKAVENLEKERAEVVVLRVRSDGGNTSAARIFQAIFENKYKPRFRTVAWIDSSFGATSLCLLPIEEWYFTSGGVLGWSPVAAPEGQAPIAKEAMERIVNLADSGSRLGGRDPKIAHSLIMHSALSYDLDPGKGASHFRSDARGSRVLNSRVPNRPGDGFTLKAADAASSGISRGTADDRESLAAALGIGRVDWVGQEAEALIEESRAAKHARFRSLSSCVDLLRRDLERLRGGNFSPADAGLLPDRARLLVDQALGTPREDRGMLEALGVSRAWLEDADREVSGYERRSKVEEPSAPVPRAAPSTPSTPP